MMKKIKLTSLSCRRSHVSIEAIVKLTIPKHHDSWVDTPNHTNTSTQCVTFDVAGVLSTQPRVWFISALPVTLFKLRWIFQLCLLNHCYILTLVHKVVPAQPAIISITRWFLRRVPCAAELITSSVLSNCCPLPLRLLSPSDSLCIFFLLSLPLSSCKQASMHYNHLLSLLTAVWLTLNPLRLTVAQTVITSIFLNTSSSPSALQ